MPEQPNEPRDAPKGLPVASELLVKLAAQDTETERVRRIRREASDFANAMYDAAEAWWLARCAEDADQE